MGKFSPIVFAWALLYLLFHALGQKTQFVHQLLGCAAFSVLMAQIVNAISPTLHVWIPINMHRVVPMTLAQDMHGVQPMTKPEDLIFSFRPYKEHNEQSQST